MNIVQNDLICQEFWHVPTNRDLSYVLINALKTLEGHSSKLFFHPTNQNSFGLTYSLNDIEGKGKPYKFISRRPIKIHEYSKYQKWQFKLFTLYLCKKSSTYKYITF